MVTTRTLKTVFLNLAKVAVIAALGFFVFALTFQILVASGVLNADMDGEGYGRALIQQAVLIWLGSVMVALLSLPIKAGWRWPLTLAPLYAPALFAVFHALA